MRRRRETPATQPLAIIDELPPIGDAEAWRRLHRAAREADFIVAAREHLRRHHLGGGKR